jgi:hypothetical protein
MWYFIFNRDKRPEEYRQLYFNLIQPQAFSQASLSLSDLGLESLDQAEKFELLLDVYFNGDCILSASIDGGRVHSSITCTGSGCEVQVEKVTCSSRAFDLLNSLYTMATELPIVNSVGTSSSNRICKGSVGLALSWKVLDWSTGRIWVLTDRHTPQFRPIVESATFCDPSNRFDSYRLSAKCIGDQSLVRQNAAFEGKEGVFVLRTVVAIPRPKNFFENGPAAKSVGVMLDVGQRNDGIDWFQNARRGVLSSMVREQEKWGEWCSKAT